jgi:hypothetical protein
MASHHPHSHELIHEPQNQPKKDEHQGPVSHVDHSKHHHDKHEIMKDQVAHSGMSAGNHLMKGHHETNPDGTAKNPTHSALGSKDTSVSEEDDEAAGEERNKETANKAEAGSMPAESHHHAKQQGTDNVYNFTK